MKMTDEEVRNAVTNVLEQYGELIRIARGTQASDRQTVGAVTVMFHDDGNYSFAFAGVFQKAMALGALADCQLSLREQINAQQAADNLAGLFEAAMLDPSDIN